MGFSPDVRWSGFAAIFCALVFVLAGFWFRPLSIAAKWFEPQLFHLNVEPPASDGAPRSYYKDVRPAFARFVRIHSPGVWWEPMRLPVSSDGDRVFGTVWSSRDRYEVEIFSGSPTMNPVIASYHLSRMSRDESFDQVLALRDMPCQGGFGYAAKATWQNWTVCVTGVQTTGAQTPAIAQRVAKYMSSHRWPIGPGLVSIYVDAGSFGGGARWATADGVVEAGSGKDLDSMLAVVGSMRRCSH